MTANKLLSRLLKMKGFKVTWFKILKQENILEVGVKPHKTGCRCPHCGRRGKILVQIKCRTWEDIVICGMRSFFLCTP